MQNSKNTSAYNIQSDMLVSVIVPAMNEEKTITSVVREAYKVHPHTEVIVVANGCKDRTAELAERAGAAVIHYEHALGHDVGRAAGAAAARGKVLLFIDGDMPILADQLKPFVYAVGQAGLDIALNRYNGPVHLRQVHPVVAAKHTLNFMLHRADLKGASMTAVPHALSRKAIEAIGSEHLTVPPLFMTMAIAAGLRVEAVHHVDVGTRNRKRPTVRKEDELKSIVLSDHLQAIDWFIGRKGSRGGRGDLERDRSRVR